MVVSPLYAVYALLAARRVISVFRPVLQAAAKTPIVLPAGS